MPESPLVQKETVALTDLEALIVARAKGESETELGFRKRIDREEAEYKHRGQAPCRQIQGRQRGHGGRLREARDDPSSRRFSAIRQATKAEYAQTKKQIDDSSRKTSAGPRNPRKKPAGRRWRCLKGQRDEGIKWRRGTEAAWNEEIAFLHAEQDNAEYVLKRCGRLAQAPPEAPSPDALAAAATSETAAPPAEGTTAPDPAATLPEAEGEQPTDGEAPAEPPAELTPLVSLQGLRASTEEHRIAIEALKLPKFLKVDSFIWPWLLLGGGAAAGLGFGVPALGWTTAANRRGRGRGGLGSGRLPGLQLNGPPQRGQAQRPLAAGPGRRRAASLNERKTGSRTNSTPRSRSSRRSANRRCATPTRTWRAGSPSFRAASKSDGRGRQDLPGQARADSPAPRRGDQEGRGAISPEASPRSRRSTKRIAKSSTSLTARPRRPPSSTTTRPGTNLIKDWTEGMARIDGALAEVREEAERRFLEWDRPELDGWKPPSEVPPGLRFGAFDVDLSQFPNGIPVDPRLKSVPTHFELPALLPFPIQGSMLIKAADAGKDEAITLLQSLMLRYLTSVPPGKVRFTIVDPGRPGRELRRLHAPGRLPRAPGHQPDLDRGAAHRAAA